MRKTKLLKAAAALLLSTSALAVSPNLYTIELKPQIVCEDESFSMERDDRGMAPEEIMSATMRDLTKNVPRAVHEFVSAVSGYEEDTWQYEGYLRENNVLSVSIVSDKNYESLKEDVDTFIGDAAADTWMEGEISIRGLEGENGQPACEMYLDFVSFKESAPIDDDVRYIVELIKNNDANLTEIIMEESDLRFKEIATICEALAQNTHVEKLFLSYENIGDNGAYAIAQMMKDNNTLKQLFLGYGNIGARGGKYLAEALKDNYTITTLDLEWNTEISEENIDQIDGYLERNQRN